MSTPIPTPNPCAFIMLGETAVRLAGHFETSVNEHVPVHARAQMAYVCISEHPERMDRSTAQCYTLSASPSGIMANILMHYGNNAQRLADGIQLDTISLYFIVKAGEVTADDIKRICSGMQDYLQQTGNHGHASLCIIADHNPVCFTRQAEWLRSGDALHPAFERFGKILLVSDCELNSFAHAGIALRMQDAIPIAMLKQQSIDDRVFALAFNKLNGSSADIERLQAHLAAKVIDEWFGRTSIPRNDVWKMLTCEQLPDVDSARQQLNMQFMNTPNGTSFLLSALTESAKPYLPTLDDLALTAPLQERDADLISYILEFENLNGASFTLQDEWGEDWLAQLRSDLPRQTHLDALLAALQDTSPTGIRRQLQDISISMNEDLNGANGLNTPGKLAQMLTQSADIVQSRFFERNESINLRRLAACCSAYSEYCCARIVLARAEYMIRHIDELTAYVSSMIAMRRNALARFMLPPAEYRALNELCNTFAQQMLHHFQNTSIEELFTYFRCRPDLYSGSARTEEAWITLHQDFVSTAPAQPNFTQAFVQGRTRETLISQLEPLKSCRLMLPGPLPNNNPVNILSFYLASSTLTDLLNDPEGGCKVHDIPGDLVEMLVLAGVGTTANDLLRFNMFTANDFDQTQQAEQVQGAHGAAGNNTNTPLNTTNPWNMRLRNNILSWTHPYANEQFSVSFDNTVVISNCSYDRYIAGGNGISLARVAHMMPKTPFTIIITCRGERCSITAQGRRTRTAITPERAKRAGTIQMDTDGRQYRFKKHTASSDGTAGTSSTFSTEHGLRRFFYPVVYDNDDYGPFWLDADNGPAIDTYIEQ